MLQTFEAKLIGNKLEWIDEIPDIDKPISVYVTMRENIESIKNKQERGKKMADILQKIADAGGIDIDDPVAWQSEIRQDRILFGRE